MNEFEKLTLKNREYLYDVDTNLIYNFTHFQVEYVYTQNQTEVADVLTATQLHDKLELNIQSVLYCKGLDSEPVLVILANDNEQTIHIFCYHVSSKQISQVISKTKFKNEISKASITRNSFDVVFKDKKYPETKSCYGLVIGTAAGDSSIALIHIDPDTFEANLMSIELIKSETELDLGYITSIHILTPDKGDRRMGHSDPQILLGYSKGSVLIYRYRANIYAKNANRLRAPIDLSEFTEFPDYPITCLSGVRSYNSLGMTVVFSQEKPLDNAKYEYSRAYIKIVETYGDSTRKQRKIINPTHIDSTILATNLLLPSFKTTEFDPDIQLSIILLNKDTFELEIWSISPTHIQRDLDLELDKQTCFYMLPGRRLRSDNLLGYYQHTPQKLILNILKHQKNLVDEQSKIKRKAENETSDKSVNKKHKKVKSPALADAEESKIDSEMHDVDNRNIPTKEDAVSESSSQKSLDSSALVDDNDLMDFENIGSDASTDEKQGSGSISHEQVVKQAMYNIIAANLENDELDDFFMTKCITSRKPPSTNNLNESVKREVASSFKSIQESVRLIGTRLEDTITREIEESSDMIDPTVEEDINTINEISEIYRTKDGIDEPVEIDKLDDLSEKNTTDEIVEESIENTKTDYSAMEDTNLKPSEQSITANESNSVTEEVTEPMGVIMDVPEIENVATEDDEVKLTEEDITDTEFTDVKSTEESITVDESGNDNKETIDHIMEIADSDAVVTEEIELKPTEESITEETTTSVVEIMDVYNTIPVDEKNEQKNNSNEVYDDFMEMLESNNSINQDSIVETLNNIVDEEKSEVTRVDEKDAEDAGIDMMKEAIKMAEAINSVIEDTVVKSTEDVVEMSQGPVTISETEVSTVDNTATEQVTNESTETSDLSTVNKTVETTQKNIPTGENYIEPFEMVDTATEQSELDQTDLQHVESLSNQPQIDTNYNQSMQFLEEDLLGLVEQVASTQEESQVLQDGPPEVDQEYAMEQSAEPTSSVAEVSFSEESDLDMLESTIEIGSSDSEIHASFNELDNEVISDELALNDELSRSDISFEEDGILDSEHESFDEYDGIPDYGDDYENSICDSETSEVSYDGQDTDVVRIIDDSDGLGYQGDTGEHGDVDSQDDIDEGDSLGSQGDTSDHHGNVVYDENEEASILLGSQDSEDSDNVGEISPCSEDQIESVEEADEDSLAVETDLSGAQSLITSPSVTESRELTPAVDIEQILKQSEQNFSELLYQVTGEEDISSFMDQPLIPREQLDELGISCWYNPDPRMKLTLVRYCDNHNLGTHVVPLCYILKKSKKDLTKDEIDEYTNIYKKHLFKYPMYNQDINVFTVEGHQQLLQNELNYYKRSTARCTNPESEKNHKIYNNYYGFGLL